MAQEKQDYLECLPKSLSEVVSSALEWAGKYLDPRCLHPVVSSCDPQRQSIQLELRLKGKQNQKDHSCGVGGWRHTRPGLCLFRR